MNPNLLLPAVLILLCGCKTVDEKKPFPAATFTPVKSVRSSDSQIPAPEKMQTPLESYTGKYAREQLAICSQIPSLYQKTLIAIAKNLGIAYRKQIVLALRDWRPQDKNVPYSIESRIVEGKMRRQVCLITEQLVSQGHEFGLYFPRALIEAIVDEQATSHHIPDWFRYGVIYCGLGQDKLVAQKFMAQMLEDPRGLSDEIAGVGQGGPFPKMEGYFAFIYLRERYGKSKLKDLIVRVMWEGNDWEQSLLEITGLNVPDFQNNARLYTIDFVKNRYWPAIVAYRKALRLYLLKRYLEAIPAFSELSFQFPDSFMSGNLAFWLGMCYYRLDRHADASGYFEQCRKEYPLQCTHFSIARYRHAMCLYRQTKIDNAILELSDFERDFPYSELCASARFFLAECFAQRSQWLRAHNWYEKFLEKSPHHSRAGEARIKAGKICLELGWYARAKKHYRAALVLQLPSEDSNRCGQALEKIKATEEGAPPPFLTAHLDEISSGFEEKDATRQQAIIREMAEVGILALPWLRRLANQCQPAVIKDLIEAISQSKAPSSTPVLVEILKKYPQFSCEVLAGLVKIGIPANFLQDIAAETQESMSASNRKRIDKAFDFVLWGSSDSLRKRIPDLLEKLNGDAAQQLQMLDRLSLDAGQEQVPVLLRLLKDGANKQVKIEALENLLAWKDPRSIPMLIQMLSGKEEDFYVPAINGLVELNRFPANELEKMLSGPLFARLAAVDALAQGPLPEHRKILLRALENPWTQVREKAAEKLLFLPHSEIFPLAIGAFLEQNHSVHFYMGVVEILEKITRKRVPYRPDMTFEQRKRLVDGLSIDG